MIQKHFEMTVFIVRRRSGRVSAQIRPGRQLEPIHVDLHEIEVVHSGNYSVTYWNWCIFMLLIQISLILIQNILLIHITLLLFNLAYFDSNLVIYIYVLMQCCDSSYNTLIQLVIFWFKWSYFDSNCHILIQIDIFWFKLTYFDSN